MPESKLTTVVPDELDGKRLDQALASLYPQHSRSRLQSWIRAGNVKVNKQLIRQRDIIKAGEYIEIIPVFEASDNWTGEAIPLDIIHEDKSIIVLNKPAGLLVHPGAGNPKHTLLNALLHYDAELIKVPRAGIVHRLDKDTSGLLVIAKTPTTHTYLVKQLQQRKIKREYQAIVLGSMTAGGTVDAPIGRHPIQRKRMSVTDKGKPAITYYRILKKYPLFTHVQLQLESGRTHQIRVHMSHIRYPIIGDPVYNKRKHIPKNLPENLRKIVLTFPRQALHAFALELVHPTSDKKMTWQAPIPQDMQTLIAALNQTLDE